MNIRIVVVQGGVAGRTFSLTTGEYRIGRGEECRIRINSDLVSRQHSLLTITDSTVALRDLGSRHGTLVNGERVTAERVLQHGDQIQIYPLVLEVQMDDLTPLPPALSTTPELVENPVDAGS